MFIKKRVPQHSYPHSDLRMIEWFVDLENDEPDESEMQAISLANLLAKELREMQERNPLEVIGNAFAHPNRLLGRSDKTTTSATTSGDNDLSVVA